MALLDIGGRVVGKVLGLPEAPPNQMDPLSLGGGKADALLAEAEYSISMLGDHNVVHPLRVNLGPAGADETWMRGMMPCMGALSKLSQMPDHENVFERSKQAFEEETAGLVDGSGNVSVELEYRMLVARKP